MKKDTILAIIPARGGSKTIPKKNLVMLGDKPLVACPIELALSVKRIDRVLVSTDDDEIASVAKHYGAHVPFKRPAYLAKDKTPTLPVLQHAIRFLQVHESYMPDVILLLYATSPFLKKERIEEALDLFQRTGCNSVMGVQKDWGRFWKLERGSYRPFYPKKRANRQQYQPLLREAGNIYFSRREVIMNMNVVVDEKCVEYLFVDDEETLDIDSKKDLEKAQQWLKLKENRL